MRETTKTRDSFDKWLETLDKEHQARIVGFIEGFETVREEITEPDGSLVEGSRYRPNVYALYPKARGASFIVYCYLAENWAYVVHGYDANSRMDHRAEEARVDKMLEDDGIVDPAASK